MSGSNKAPQDADRGDSKGLPPPHRLPPVGQRDMPNCGRQTEVLEHVNPYSVAADEQKSLSSLGGATHPLLDGLQ